MKKAKKYPISFAVGFLLFAALLPIQVGHGTTWGEVNLKSFDDLRDEDLVDLNHPGLFPDLMVRPRQVEPEPRELIEPKVPEKPEAPERPQRPVIDEKIPLERFGLVQRIHFDYDRSNIKSEYVEGLRKNAAWIKKNPQYRILIEGHCDERGSNEYNIALGERRANSTKQFLVNLGVESDRLITKSWGEEKPLDLGKTEEAYALNRRAEFFAIRTSE